ncbi:MULTISPECIES: phage tail assembly protein [unclassified Serratia (in: enterobacteria)]|uniref:phage tail assembly protein n=1 Tax=unclassified Serratia (in: enterobacteria) TaxID=2647522 RepID=UPI0005063B80|nr:MULTISPECIES: phage tail assembly protein [unclassified Serratia (in: enterobacteria)]KFK91711.1 mu-like prophage FluMu gp41 family protein [Serratia sp. Ag2]KFK98580.1 mu-like prophage FluMu gp41 family protein [Serratia sp. Ag1]
MSQSEMCFTLKFPYSCAAGNNITELPLRRLSVKDLKAARKISSNAADWDDILLSRATGMLPEDFDNMDLEDYLELQKRFQKITGMGKGSEGANPGAGAAGEVVPVPAE